MWLFSLKNGGSSEAFVSRLEEHRSSCSGDRGPHRQFLAGRMHAFDAYFPSGNAQPNGSANSLLLSTGGGV
jgi:hypothetical protein